MYLHRYQLHIDINYIYVMYLHNVPIRFLCFIYFICVDSNHQSEKIEGQFLLLRFEFLEFMILFNMNPDIH
jgi:hypothetical protein